jgi:hypothetical protein
MELLGEWVMRNLVSVRLKKVLLLVRWFSMVTRLKWKLDSFRLDIVLILTLDRCIVCAERTIGLEITLDAPDGSPRQVGHVESRFGPFGDSVSVGAI